MKRREITEKSRLAMGSINRHVAPQNTTRGRALAKFAPLLCGTVSVFAVAAAPQASAMNLYKGSMDGTPVEINLDTTVEYSTFYRVNDPSSILLSNSNVDDGDRNFRHGFVSNEFSITPTLDLTYGNYGAHVSGQAYLNTSYLGTNQNNSPSTVNPILAKNTDFASATRNVNGQNAMLLDAFVYGSKYFGAGQNQEITLKVGRSTLLWGQSLFFSQNGIAAGMAPINLQTAQTLPNAETQQIIMPVGQVIATYQPNQILTFQAYYQFEWEPFFFQGVGSYFSFLDVLDKGGQREVFGNGFYAYRAKDLRPNHNPQFGGSVQATLGNYDLGFYGLRYDSKTPELVNGAPGAGGSGGPGAAGSYWLVYPRDISIFGSSLSTDIGNANVAGEISFRRNMPLDSTDGKAPYAYPGTANGMNTAWATGTTMAAQVSAICLIPPMPLISGGVSLAGEAAMNHVISVVSNRNLLTAGRNATAGQFAFTVTPQYYDLIPQTVLAFPIGVNYNLFGLSEIDSSENHGTGSVNFGVTFTYKTTWIANLTYNDYIGAPAPAGANNANPLADRGWVNLNIQHTF